MSEILYAHQVYCNAKRSTPIGEGICSCFTISKRLYKDLVNKVKELEAKNKKFKGILVGYGSHLKGCNAEYSPVHPCTCGFNDSMAKVFDLEK